MRINEAYEHETLLSRRPEEESLANVCNKVVTQSVDVTAPVILRPTASLGSVTVACQGAPTVRCDTDPDGACCTVTLTQQICVTMPVRYGVSLGSGEAMISCCRNECGPSCGCKG